MSATHYETLGLPHDADASAIRRAHRTLARTYHPDVNKGSDAARHFARIQTAYETLIDPDSRAAYDAGLKRGLGWHHEAPTGPFTPAPSVWADLARQELEEEVDQIWQTFFEPRIKARADSARK